MDRTAAKQWWPAALGILLLIGLLLRVWGAWTIQYSPNSDFGIVALMAKYMAEGTAFPVFFFGQAYMGSFEPAISALLCRIFGVSGFMVTLGTALLGFFVLPLVFVLARRMAGPRAALVALLYLLVGSDTNFHYAIAPRGGYMSMQVMGLACLLLAIRIARRLATGERLRTMEFAALGLCAGIGWWSNQLVIVFLLPAALMLLIGLRRADFLSRTPIALGTFLFGSAPWWWWNANHQWASFGFRGSLGSVPVTEGVVSFWYQFLESISAWPAGKPLHALRIALTTAAVGIMLFNLIRQLRAGHRDESFWTRLAGALTILAMIAMYSTSHYARHNASRYVLPIIPVFALALSDAAATLVRRIPRPIVSRVLAALLVLPAISPHYRHIPGRKDAMASDLAIWRGGLTLVETAADISDGVLYGDYAYHWINFPAAGNLVIATTPADRYAPYTLRAARTTRPAFLMNHERIRSFVQNTRGRAREKRAHGYSIVHSLTPPETAWRYVEPGNIRIEGSWPPRFPPAAVTDDVLDESPPITLTPESPFVWTAVFEPPVRLAGLRYLTPGGEYPHDIGVSLLDTQGGAWREVFSGLGDSKWFWSGPRVYPAPFLYFPELRFAPTDEPIVAARIRFSTAAEAQRVELGNWLFLEELGGPEMQPPDDEHIEPLIQLVQRHGIRRLYAPRWVSERMALGTPPFELALPHAYDRDVQDIPRQDHPVMDVRISDGTGLLCWEQDAARTRRVLERFELAFEEQEAAPWRLFALRDPPPGPAREFSVLLWNETGCWAADMRRHAKTRAHRIYRQHVTETRAEGIERMRMALALYPAHQPAIENIVEWLAEAGRTDEAEAYSRQGTAITTPPIPAPIRFPNGAEFLGFTISTRSVRPGELFEITYHWKCPPKGNHALWAFFVHFVADGGLFQDDHIFMEGIPSYDIEYQPFDEVFTVTRHVIVPLDTKPGEYRAQVGLYDRRDGKRLKPRTALPYRRGAVASPLTFTVSHADAP